MATQSTTLVRASSQFWSIADASQTGLDFSNVMTLGGWVNITNAPSAGVYGVICKWDPGTNQRSYRFEYVDSAGTKQLRYVNSNLGGVVDDVCAVTQSLGTAAWHLIVLTIDLGAAEAKFYYDGSQVGGTQTTTVATQFNGTAPFYVGNGDVGASNFMDGQMSDMRAWNRVLTSTEIGNWFTTPCTFVNGTNLQGQWTFDGNGNDASGNSNTLTNNGSATFTSSVPYSCSVTGPSNFHAFNLLGVGV